MALGRQNSNRNSTSICCTYYIIHHRLYPNIIFVFENLDIHMYEYDIQNLDHKDPCTDPFDQPEVKLNSRHRRG